MKHNPYFILSLAVITFGCTLEDAPDLGDSCKDAVYYADANGQVKGQFGDPDNKHYEQFQGFHHCPNEYPVWYFM